MIEEHFYALFTLYDHTFGGDGEFTDCTSMTDLAIYAIFRGGVENSKKWCDVIYEQLLIDNLLSMRKGAIKCNSNQIHNSKSFKVSDKTIHSTFDTVDFIQYLFVVDEATSNQIYLFLNFFFISNI